MFATGATLALKRTKLDIMLSRPVVHVRVKFVSGRAVHTNRGVFHYWDLEVPAGTRRPAPALVAPLWPAKTKTKAETVSP